MKKIKSVLDLAKYKVGDKPYWIILTNDKLVDIMDDLDDEDEWMSRYHPHILYKRGPIKDIWPYKGKLPKLAHYDFECVVEFLSSRMVVDNFEIHDIIKSRNTGEFIYFNEYGEQMPEEFLFDTKSQAEQEIKRIKGLVRKWLNR